MKLKSMRFAPHPVGAFPRNAPSRVYHPVGAFLRNAPSRVYHPVGVFPRNAPFSRISRKCAHPSHSVLQATLICILSSFFILPLPAMPTREETAQAVPVVKQLLASERAALAAGKKTRTEVADAALKLAQDADTEAAKLLLMKGAFVLYVKDGQVEKAARTMNAIEKTIADLPPQSVTNMIDLALLGLPKKDGERLYQCLGASKVVAAPLGCGKMPHQRRGGILASPEKNRTTIQSIIDGMIKVSGKDFWLSETELTQGQWKAVMGNNPSRHKGVNLPVECVSRDDCDVFLAKLNQTKEVQTSRFEFYLPTLPEWMYAAQAGGSGTDCCVKPGVVGAVLDMAWVKENSGGETHPVAAKTPNAFGFYDMLGNVWEWMYGEDQTIGCRHGFAFDDAAAECSVKKGWHRPRSQRFDHCGLRVAARVRPVGGGETCADEF